MAAEYIAACEGRVLDDHQITSYRWLARCWLQTSRFFQPRLTGRRSVPRPPASDHNSAPTPHPSSLQVRSQAAQRALHAFCEANAKDGRCEGAYIVCGTDGSVSSSPTSSSGLQARTVRLVRHSELDAAKAGLEQVTGIHAYSTQPPIGPNTGAALYATDVAIHAKEMFSSETPAAGLFQRNMASAIRCDEVRAPPLDAAAPPANPHAHTPTIYAVRITLQVKIGSVGTRVSRRAEEALSSLGVGSTGSKASNAGRQELPKNAKKMSAASFFGAPKPKAKAGKSKVGDKEAAKKPSQAGFFGKHAPKKAGTVSTDT